MKNLSLEPLPILAVDDEEGVLKSLVRDLRELNPIETCTDANLALERFRDTEYAVVISDFKMPQMDGLEFLETCASTRPECQRVLLTAYADLADLGNLINRAKLNGFLAKPWEKAPLQSFIRSCINNNYLLRENTQLRRMAWTDSLTQIPNNRYFWERLESEFSRAKRYSRPLSLIMADIDDFKKFNDQYGHQHGDKVLFKVAQSLEGLKRQMDTVARYGGEEFAVILPEASLEQAMAIADRLRISTAQKTDVHLSFGVASYPDNVESSSELLHKADLALIEAKKRGKNQVVSSKDLAK
ncbi:GGDEF domain-containing response regulator [bacterium]|nr:GGDEF domain-containing response regulator [bacterium]